VVIYERHWGAESAGDWLAIKKGKRRRREGMD
jgi:hypothetical protein